MRLAGSLLACFLLAMPPCAAQDGGARFVDWENDSPFKSDRHYTNGIQFSSRSAQDDLGELARRWTDAACRLFGCADARLLFVQRDLGQLMYTPADITRSTPQPADRPWAGLLYLGRRWLFLAPDGMAITTLAAQAGVTGNAALAEPAQKLFHRLFERPMPQGWQHQVGTTAALLVSAERRSAWPRLSGPLAGGVRLHTAGHWRLALGNTMTYAAGGLSVTIGKGLPPVAPGPPGIANRIAPVDTACLWSWLQCTLVLDAEARAIGYNLFLQGRPGRDDPAVKPRRWVGDLAAGLRLDFPGTRGPDHGPWFVQVRAIRRTAEFRAPAAARHTVAALTVGIDF